MPTQYASPTPAHLRLSSRTQDLHASPIREILSVIDRPGMISFAGGLPAVDTFPSFSLNDMPQEVLQYGASEGDWPLRQKIATELAEIGLSCTPEQVLILSGSQQGIDMVAKLFIDANTPVAVESHTYLAALQVFRFYGARFVPFEAQHANAAHLSAQQPAFVYSIPTFQNPSGRCLSAAERSALAQACDASNTPLFEDDPYRDLVYDACDRTPVCALLQHAPWIYQGSFSKSLAPGLRLGYMVASLALLPMLTRLKQAADLHSNRMSQWLVLQQLNNAHRQSELANLAAHYKLRRDAFEVALQQHFGDLATWEKPPGGLFFWLKLNQSIDTRRVLPLAIEQGVAFMPGEPFLPFETTGCGQLRLNFSHASPAQADEGLQKLAALIRTMSANT